MKPKIYVLEGPDCTGKTTLAKFMAEKFKAAYIHAGYFGGSPQLHARYLEDQLLSAMACIEAGLNVIMDRHWPSEYCYAPVLRPKTAEAALLLNSATRLKELDATYIFCQSEKAVKKQALHEHAMPLGDFHTIINNYYILGAELMSTDKIAFYHLEEDGADINAFLARLP